MAGVRSSLGRWRCIGPRTLASGWTGSLVGTAAKSSRHEGTCSPSLTSLPEPPSDAAAVGDAPKYGVPGPKRQCCSPTRRPRLVSSVVGTLGHFDAMLPLMQGRPPPPEQDGNTVALCFGLPLWRAEWHEA